MEASGVLGRVAITALLCALTGPFGLMAGAVFAFEAMVGGDKEKGKDEEKSKEREGEEVEKEKEEPELEVEDKEVLKEALREGGQAKEGGKAAIPNVQTAGAIKKVFEGENLAKHPLGRSGLLSNPDVAKAMVEAGGKFDATSRMTVRNAASRESAMLEAGMRAAAGLDNPIEASRDPIAAATVVAVGNRLNERERDGARFALPSISGVEASLRETESKSPGTLDNPESLLRAADAVSKVPGAWMGTRSDVAYKAANDPEYTVADGERALSWEGRGMAMTAGMSSACASVGSAFSRSGQAASAVQSREAGDPAAAPTVAARGGSAPAPATPGGEGPAAPAAGDDLAMVPHGSGGAARAADAGELALVTREPDQEFLTLLDDTGRAAGGEGRMTIARQDIPRVVEGLANNPEAVRANADLVSGLARELAESGGIVALNLEAARLMENLQNPGFIRDNADGVAHMFGEVSGRGADRAGGVLELEDTPEAGVSRDGVGDRLAIEDAPAAAPPGEELGRDEPRSAPSAGISREGIGANLAGDDGPLSLTPPEEERGGPPRDEPSLAVDSGAAMEADARETTKGTSMGMAGEGPDSRSAASAEHVHEQQASQGAAVGM